MTKSSRRFQPTILVEDLPKVSPPIGEVLDEYLTGLRNAARAPSYLESFDQYLGSKAKAKKDWKPLTLFARERGVEVVAQLTKEVITDWLDHLRAARSEQGYARGVKLLNRFLRYLVAEEILPELPIKVKAPREVVPEIPVFSEAEIARLHTVVRQENIRDLAIFLLLVETGIRSKELVSLTVDQVRLERRQILVPEGVAKTGKFRPLFITYDTVKVLKKYLSYRERVVNADDALFLGLRSSVAYAGGRGKKARRMSEFSAHAFSPARLTGTGLYQLVRKWGKLAKITEGRCSPHTFRHYYAVTFLRNGGREIELRQHLGHSRLDMTQRYATLAAGDLQSSQDKFSPALRLTQIRYRTVEVR